MPLHICFVDYHSEMKFEQLLKIICKRYFLLFFLLLTFYYPPPPHPCPLVCWRRGERWYRPQCKQTHRAAMMLIVFPKHILGPYPHCRELSIYRFLFPYCTACSETFMMVSEAQWNRGLLLDLSFSKKRNLCHVRCSNIHWHCLLKGILAPRWGSVVWVIWRANIVNWLL